MTRLLDKYLLACRETNTTRRDKSETGNPEVVKVTKLQSNRATNDGVLLEGEHHRLLTKKLGRKKKQTLKGRTNNKNNRKLDEAGRL